MRAYSAAELAILTAPAVEVSAGCDLLNPDLSFREDISDYLVDGSVEWSLYASIHRTCDLALTRTLRWGVDYVRPYMILTANGASARFNAGVFLLTTPERRVGEVPETVDAQGYDRLSELIDELGQDYTITAGTTYRQALLDVFALAEVTGVLIEGSAADETLPQAKSYPLIGERVADPDQTDSPTTFLRVINDLLRQIRFRSLWCDENGVYRCQEYQAPSSRPDEFEFNADDTLAGIVGEDRSVLEDSWKVPNRWTFRWTNPPDGTLLADQSTVIVNQSDGPLSVDGRGRTKRVTIDYEAASRAKFLSLATDRVASDRAVSRRVELNTGPLPVAGHADIVKIIDSAAGLSGKAQAVSWSLPLDGADMTWNLELTA